MLPGYTAPKLLWLKENEPANFRRLTSVLLPHDYLNLWLTGERQMEYGDASGTGLMDVRTRNWSKPILEFIDPKLESLLPPLRSSKRPAGLLRSVLREQWGLADDALVSAGKRRQHDGRDRHRQYPGRRCHREPRHIGHDLRLCGRTGDRPEGRSRRLLRQHRPLAAARLHDERHGRDRADARTLWLGHSDMEERVAAVPAGAGGLLFFPTCRASAHRTSREAPVFSTA